MAASASKLKEPFPHPAEPSGQFGGALRLEPAPRANHTADASGCMRGVRFALLIEIVAGLLGYEVWRLFRG